MGCPAYNIHPATLADLEALPPHIKGEIIDGALYTQPRPRFFHQRVISLVGTDIVRPYSRGPGGPGKWWILPEPGIEVPGSPEFSPDIAGWRFERLPRPPQVESIQVVPDWVCEVLSPSTRAYDLQTKKPFYARIGVKWLWLIDLQERVFIAHRLTDDGSWRELGAWEGNAKVRAQPFDAAQIDINEWWPTVTHNEPRAEL